ncbi:FAD-dependent oxidoreductase [Cohnella rhizosphaerae]|uniref:FAD-dependent oxidoreductase n=1 Tax=Cohnella rhizosphaerae TaxID=1457232 RepID=A0A9X4QRG3_9BACL|nr:FAD-dependent oxidoreductase [Cohnella rhizosphaerae]MDG0808214.1 FAD-dependent oxidoreductase [Cohnella rhizosphaerae]
MPSRSGSKPFTHLIALSYHPENDFTIPKPVAYEKFYPKFSHITATTERSGAMAGLFAENDADAYRQSMWNFRRHFCRDNFDRNLFNSDITVLMNGNEYRDRVLTGVSPTEKQTALEEAKALSLSLVYYLQTELGFKGLLPRPDVFDTSNGLAAHPYIRESRRIKAEFTIREQDFRIDMHPDGPVDYADSVGVSGYRIDIHEKAKDGGPNITSAVHGQHWVQQLPPRRTHPRTSSKPDSCLQKHRYNPRYQWFLPGSFHRMEYRRSCRFIGGILPEHG